VLGAAKEKKRKKKEEKEKRREEEERKEKKKGRRRMKEGLHGRKKEEGEEKYGVWGGARVLPMDCCRSFFISNLNCPTKKSKRRKSIKLK
jgi:hypothetical protein